MIIAADVEGTLTTGETWKGMARYFLQHGQGAAYRLFLATHLPALALTKLKLMSRQRFRDRWIEDLPRLMRGRSLTAWQQAAAWVVEDELWPKRRQAVIDELLAQQREGHRLILASGTYQPVLAAFAAKLAAEAVGTPLEWQDGKATGNLGGAVNNAATKAERLRQYLGDAALDRAYGDTVADIPMLSLSRIAVAVYPDAGLQAHAEQAGWRIIRSLAVIPLSASNAARRFLPHLRAQSVLDCWAIAAFNLVMGAAGGAMAQYTVKLGHE